MDNKEFGRMLKQRRLFIPLTLQELAAQSGVSASHLGRMERGERFPSARILKKIAKPLDFDEAELLTLAGFMSPKPAGAEKEIGGTIGKLDPYVAKMLAEEPAEIQRVVIGILIILKSIAKGIAQGNR